MKVLGLIPARGGSQRVKNKNIKLLNDKPLIQYTIEAGLNSKLLSDLVVSTESKEIAEISKSIGANVPFYRPEELAGNNVGDKEVLQHALKWLKNEMRLSYDAIVYLRPTTPFKTSKIIDDVISKLISLKADSVRTVTPVESINHPYWMFRISEKQKAVPFDQNHSIEDYYQSQLLPPVYRLNGVADIILTNVVMDNSTPLYGNDMRLHSVNEKFAYDIDTDLDFKVCEFLMRLR